MDTAYCSDLQHNFALLLATERPRLVRLCAHLAGDIGAAEDLAQETLLEAWRQHHRLVDATGSTQWLTAIARYVCLRWHRRQVQEWRHRAPAAADQLAAPDDGTAALADTFDLEVELERHELATLLDRALALLPPEARTLLIQKYIEDSPHAAIAAQLGVSEGAVAMRLQRGKLAFRRVLSTQLRPEAAAYGLAGEAHDTWQETRIWCPACGQQRLVSLFAREHDAFSVRCPTCFTTPGGYFTGMQLPHLFDGIQGYKAALSRTMQWDHAFLRHALPSGSGTCFACGHHTRVRCELGGAARHLAGDVRGVDASCVSCGCPNWMTLPSLVRCTPEVRRFWQRHPRMYTLPERDIEVAGQAAVLTSFHSVTGWARMEVVSARDTFAVLEINTVDGT